jgi:hypothetical protein
MRSIALLGAACALAASFPAIKTDDVAAAAVDEEPEAALHCGSPELVAPANLRATLNHFWFPNSGGMVGANLILPIRTTCDTPCYNESALKSVVAVRDGSAFAPPPAPTPSGRSAWSIAELVPSPSGHTVDFFSASFAAEGTIITVQPHRAPATGPAATTFVGHASRWALTNGSVRATTERANVSYTVKWTNVTSLDGCGQIARIDGGSFLQSVNFNTVGSKTMGVAAFASVDGLVWNWRGVAAHPSTVEVSETALATLPDRSALIVIRTGNGFHSRAPLLSTRSDSAPLGASWTRPAPMSAATRGSELGQPWGVRPVLLPLLSTAAPAPLILSTGRPGLFLWISYTNGHTWAPLNLAAAHNEGLPKGDPNRFSAACVNATVQSPAQAETTAYTSLVGPTGGADAVVCYDRLAHGWYGRSRSKDDAVYCMPLWSRTPRRLKAGGAGR